MKKWLFAAAGAVVLLLCFVYLFIPSPLSVVVVMPAKCNVDATDRLFRDAAYRSRWWPDDRNGEFRFAITGLYRRMIEVKIDDGHLSIPSRLSVFPKVRIDSSVLQWEMKLSSPLNPVRRIERYREVSRIAAEMNSILARIKANLEDQQKVYGVSIVETTTTDSVLVEKLEVLHQSPADSDVYALAEKLKRFIANQGAHVTGYPMFNVTREMKGTFEFRVALPIDKEINSADGFQCKRLVHGKYLESEVRGGDGAVKSAMAQMRNYISDYQRTVMAIPFQSLVTDRRKEADTSMWLTRLYFPIF